MSKMQREKTEGKRTRTLTTKPWGNFVDWNESVDHLLQNLLESFAQPECDHKKAPFFNILLTGLVGSGKSSFFNNIYGAVFQRKIINKAEVNDNAKAVTEEFRMYELRQKPSSDPLPWRIGDTRGIYGFGGDRNNGVANILQIVDGHVPDRYVFGWNERFFSGSPGYIKSPSNSNKIHCVAIVYSASFHSGMSSDGLTQLQNLKKGLVERDIPTFVVLTGIDKVCGEIHDGGVSKVYHSNAIKTIVSEISKKLSIPESRVLPVKNYKVEIDLQNDMDILLLHAFRQLVGAKDRECRNMKSEIAHLVPVTKFGLKLPFYNIFLLGQIGSGKSSFFNGINAIFKKQLMTTMAETGERATSLTKEFHMYEITPLGKTEPLSMRICDTCGLNEMSDNDVDVRNVLSAIKGHVPDKHIFADKEFVEESPEFIVSPDLENKAHCVCIVIDAGKEAVMLNNVWRKLRSICTALKSRGIPAKILLAKVDLVLDTNEPIVNIHKNEKVREKKRHILLKLGYDFDEDDIFPVKNYVKEVEFDVDMNFLLLDSLLQMLKSAQKYLDTR